jgi:hypothetical protein
LVSVVRLAERCGLPDIATDLLSGGNPDWRPARLFGTSKDAHPLGCCGSRSGREIQVFIGQPRIPTGVIEDNCDMLRITVGAAILYEQQGRCEASCEIQECIAELHRNMHVYFLGVGRHPVIHVDL